MIQPRWMDETDPGNLLNAISETDLNNIIEGSSTYGIWEGFLYFDQLFYDMWVFSADEIGLGMGLGLILTSLSVRLLFAPFIMYSQITGIKLKLLKPDMDEF